MHRIGVLSDTHGLLRQEVLEALADCDVILHGGDINKQTILDQLAELAPLYVVRGNNDKEWAEYLPDTLIVDCYGKHIFMVHNKKYIPEDLKDIDLVIYGHSHKYEVKMVNGVQHLNPGSCGPRNIRQDITLAVILIEEDGRMEIQRILIPHPVADTFDSQETIPVDIGEKLSGIMTDIQSGKTIAQIAHKHRISKELSEQIMRMCMTHPGVDKDGVLRRLGL